MLDFMFEVILLLAVHNIYWNTYLWEISVHRTYHFPWAKMETTFNWWSLCYVMVEAYGVVPWDQFSYDQLPWTQLYYDQFSRNQLPLKSTPAKSAQTFYAMFISNMHVSQWNYFDSERPRANNHIEGWHSCLKKVVGKAHTNIYEIIEIFKKEEATVRMEMQWDWGYTST